LLAGKISLGHDVFDVAKNIGKAFHTTKANNEYLLIISYWVISLFRNRLELVWRIKEPPSDIVCEPKEGDQVTYTKTEAHRSSEYSIIYITVQEA